MNAWVGGFESILSKMSGINFNWFLHTMLFMHTQVIIQKQEEKRRKIEEGEESEGEDEEEVEVDSEDENDA